jgi:D-sorbitol dehydrogenase (acceptor)
MRLANKVAIVTGGGSGIGKAIVQRFSMEGARLVIADRDTDAAAGLAEELGRNAFSVACDVADLESIDSLVAAAFTEERARTKFVYDFPGSHAGLPD